MDNERPIEKLLRRYAKKRRDDVGTPPELHPATRRLLQGEVARQFRKEHDERTASSESSVRWWPRWVYGLAAFAVVAVMAAMLLPALSKSKSRSMKLASADNKKQVDMVAPTFEREKSDQLGVPLEVAKDEIVASSAREDLKPAKTADDFGTMVTNSTTLAFASVLRSESAASWATPERSAVPGASAVSGTLAAAPATTPPLELDKENANRFGDSKSDVATVEPTGKYGAEGSRFKTTDELRRNYYAQTQAAARFSNMDKSASKMPVLASFQVEQNGDELRVIDSDGSTYNGNIVPEENLRDTKTEADYTKLKEKSQVVQKAARAISGEEPRQNMPVQNTFFRLVGTNKTLGQQVIFTGNFVAVTNAGQLQVSARNISNQAQNFPGQQAFPFLFNNSIIVGRVQLEGNKDIEVNAVPVSP